MAKKIEAMKQPEFTDKQTADHLREWVKSGPHGHFSWATDGCGYNQHIRFVEHRNKHWTKEREKVQTFKDFILEYANLLDPTNGQANQDESR